METKTSLQTTTVPDGLKSLPIFQVLGNNLNSLPAKIQTPEGKKLVAKGAVAVAGVAGAAVIYTHIGAITAGLARVLTFVGYLALLLGVGGVAIIGALVFIYRFPQIVNSLDNMARVKIMGADKKFIRHNFMDQLNILLEDAKDTLVKVRAKNRDVDAARLNVIQKAQDKEKERVKSYDAVKRIGTEVVKMQAEQAEYTKKGMTEKAAQIGRDIKEALSAATLQKAEGDASGDAAKLYAQCGNQVSKVLEILRDNESAAKIYVGAITSSIKIIQDKVNVTSDINKATQNLADVFNISEGWRFLEAMDAANYTISANIANIRSNLQFVDENKGAIAGTMSVDELAGFTKQLESGNMKSLNVAQITDASYELQSSDIADNTLKILD